MVHDIALVDRINNQIELSSLHNNHRSRNEVFTYVSLLGAAHLIVPLALCRKREHGTALSFSTCRLLLGAVPVEVGDGHAVDIDVLAFFNNIRHTYPEVFGAWGAEFGVVS